MELSQRVVFTGPGIAELQDFTVEEESSDCPSLLVETLYTLISAGTELAWFSGMQKEVTGAAFTYPVYSGYCHVGRVLETNQTDETCRYRRGDIVVSGASHTSLVRLPLHPNLEVDHSDLRQPFAVVPTQIPPQQAPLAKMAEIAMTAVRIADFTLGEKILVVGQGMVGNLAAQLFQLAGADVLGVDLSDYRLKRSKASGIAKSVRPEGEEFKALIAEWTKGLGADVTVDTTGNSEVLLQSIEWTRRLGDLIVLGTPRKAVQMNPSQYLWQAHMKGVSIKGALRCLFYPLNQSRISRRSVARDLEEVLSRMSRNELKTEPLLTRFYKPAQCQEAFSALLNGGTSQMGLVFDWQSSGKGD